MDLTKTLVWRGEKNVPNLAEQLYSLTNTIKEATWLTMIKKNGKLTKMTSYIFEVLWQCKWLEFLWRKQDCQPWKNCKTSSQRHGILKSIIYWLFLFAFGFGISTIWLGNIFKLFSAASGGLDKYIVFKWNKSWHHHIISFHRTWAFNKTSNSIRLLMKQ